MSNSLIADKIKQVAANVTQDKQLELVHAEVVGTQRKPTVRIFIDKPGGVTVEDCSQVSREVGAILDAEDLIPSAYLLEVSSPGIERQLYSLQDFEKFAGQMAKVKTNAPINGQKNFRGKIVSVTGEEIAFEDKTSGSVSFPYSAVAKANLEVDFEEELRKK